jgi:hypothetical protein
MNSQVAAGFGREWSTFRQDDGELRSDIMKRHDDVARNAHRLTHGGSPNDIYRLILATTGPMLVIWGMLASRLSRSWILMLAAALLFLSIVVGKLETLSKALPLFLLYS